MPSSPATDASTGVLGALWDRMWLLEAAAVQAHNDTPYEEWKCGGRATKEWPNKENIDWWAANGPVMLEQFTQWWNANNNWMIWRSPNGDLGVELDVSGTIGGIPVKAFVDLVAYDQDGVLSVVDFKTGSSTPNSGMQLGLYATLIEQLFGVRPQRGYFYSARKAMMIPMQDISRWTAPLFTELFTQFERGLQAEIFLPNIGMTCGSCSVNSVCYAFSGTIGLDPLGEL